MPLPGNPPVVGFVEMRRSQSALTSRSSTSWNKPALRQGPPKTFFQQSKESSAVVVGMPPVRIPRASKAMHPAKLRWNPPP